MKNTKENIDEAQETLEAKAWFRRLSHDRKVNLITVHAIALAQGWKVEGRGRICRVRYSDGDLRWFVDTETGLIHLPRVTRAGNLVPGRENGHLQDRIAIGLGNSRAA